MAQVTVIYEGNDPATAEATAEGENLWVSLADATRIGGWELKPEGLCRETICIPVPRRRDPAHTRYPEATIPMGDLIWPQDRPAGEEWITLITCGGKLERPSANQPGHYPDRDVVVARRLP